MPEQQHRILAAGDSFVGIFRLFRREANFDIQKFKGATAKGLTKPLNENRLKLIELCNDPSNNYTCGVFNFGQVDVHHSFYYNVVGEKVDMKVYLDYYDTLAKNYVDFIASLDIPLKIVTAVYPSPLVTSEVPRELMTYNVLGPEDVINYSPENWWTISCRSARHARLISFNNALELACEKHADVKYISVNDSILNGDNTVRSTFKDINPVNLHLLWEPLILLWADKLSTLNLGISSKMLVDMRKSASAYNTRKIQEVGDRVFAIGPNLQLIMDYLDNQALLFNEVSEAPIAIEKSNSIDSGLSSPLSPLKTRRERVLEVSYNDWRRQSSNSDNTSNSSSSSNSNGQDNSNNSSSKNGGNGNYYSNNNNNRSSDDRKNFLRCNVSSSENYEHENVSRIRASSEDRMRGTSDGNATRHGPGQDDGRDRDRDGRPRNDSQSRPQTGRRLSDILDGRKGNHSQSGSGWSQDQSSRQTYSHNSSSSNMRSHEYDSNQRSSTMNAMERSRPYSSAPSHASPYLKGPNQGGFRGQRQGQVSGQVQENQGYGFDRMHISRQVANAEVDTSLRRTSQGLDETTRNDRSDGRGGGGGRDHGQQERDNNDLQYGR